jgi:hypothetical protein
MNLSQIKAAYIVSKLPNKNQYLLFDKEPNSGSRMVYKYLTKIEFKDNQARVIGNKSKPTRYIKELNKQIKEKINSLPYDSEYYMPLYRKGTFEYFVIYDYLREIGFKHSNSYNSSDFFVLRKDNVYNYSTGSISISINGLSTSGKIEDEINIMLYTGEYSWIEVKAKRKVKDIKTAIDSLLKPLLVSESVNFFETSEKLDNFKDVEITVKKMENMFSVKSESYKKELKKRLLEMAEKL